MAVEIINTKDLPVLTKPVDITNEDRLAISHRYTETWQGTMTVTMNAFVNGVLNSIVARIGNKRYHGTEVPGDLFGSNGDLYFLISDNRIISVYVKYDNDWKKL